MISNIKRRGDLRHVTSVRCYTRQDTAIVGKDYRERPDTNASLVVFKPRETIKPCKVSAPFNLPAVFDIAIGVTVVTSDRSQLS